jgi:hypothetical protein
MMIQLKKSLKLVPVGAETIEERDSRTTSIAKYEKAFHPYDMYSSAFSLIINN